MKTITNIQEKLNIKDNSKLIKDLSNVLEMKSEQERYLTGNEVYEEQLEELYAKKSKRSHQKSIVNFAGTDEAIFVLYQIKDKGFKVDLSYINFDRTDFSNLSKLENLLDELNETELYPFDYAESINLQLSSNYGSDKEIKHFMRSRASRKMLDEKNEEFIEKCIEIIEDWINDFTSQLL